MDVPPPAQAEHLPETLVGEPLGLVQDHEGLRSPPSGEELGPDEGEVDREQVAGGRLADRGRVSRDEDDPSGRD